jgi:hypothetical protein
LADHVDFAGDVCAFVFERDGNAAGAGGFSRECPRPARRWQDFGNVVAGDFHFHCAHLDLEMIVVDFAHARAGGRWTSA